MMCPIVEFCTVAKQVATGFVFRLKTCIPYGISYGPSVNTKNHCGCDN